VLPTTPTLQPQQIVRWDAGDRRLYAEVIQAIPERSRCWVRPLLLVMRLATVDAGDWCDLRTAPDLVWSDRAFQLALDVEVIPWLAQLPPVPQPGSEILARRQFQQFLLGAWSQGEPS